MNLYGVVGNNATSNTDILGQFFNLPAMIMGILMGTPTGLKCLEAGQPEASKVYPGGGVDKKKHCYANCFASKCAKRLASLSLTTLGVTKEISDLRQRGVFNHANWSSNEIRMRQIIADSAEDIASNIYGIIRSFPFRSCKVVCDECPFHNGYRDL